jgi:cell division protein FtsB
MANYDPIQERIDARKDAELERLRASCNSLASERDLLKKERDELAEDKRRLIVGAENLLRFNHQLSERLANALSPDRRAA